MPQLIITLPNDRRNAARYRAGRAASEHLQNPQQAMADLGVMPVAELETYLKARHVANATEVSRLPFTYLLTEVPDGDLDGAAARILRWHNDDQNLRYGHGYVERVEPNRELSPAAPTVDLGGGFTFTPQHDAYLKMLGLDPRPVINDGQGIRIAIVDSGIEPHVSHDSYADMIDANANGPDDQSGHGTAMVKIIRSVAPMAEIHIVRAFERKIALLFDVMAGLGTAFFGVRAHLINCSLGFKNLGSRCTTCGGAGGGRSKTFENYLNALTDRATLLPPGEQPLVTAAVGNDYSSSNQALFRSPADYDQVVAIGAVTSSYQLSPFSNRGTAKNHYLVLPGGDNTPGPNGGPAEAIGTAASGTTHCLGTSVATAYATGVLALYRGEANYRHLDAVAFFDNIAIRTRNQFAGYTVTDHGKGFLFFH